MIIVNIPKNNLVERRYIIDIIFGEFLGLDYKIENSSQDYEIVLENGNKLIFEDHFFNKHSDDLEYLKLKNIPFKVEFVKSMFITENDIPVIYGNSTLNINNSLIVCGIDIFASSFFMLTRWEEYVNKNRDIHNRFPAYESLAYKNKILDRPIVNEYVEMLWSMLVNLGCKQYRKERQFKFCLTHDVDYPFKYKSLTSGLMEIVVDIVKRKDLKLALKNLLIKVKVHLSMEKDPYDTFEYLMDISESIGEKSYFFFMAQGLTARDNMYKSNNKKVLEIVDNIKKRGHYIGIHPTYDAYNQSSQFTKEKDELEANFNTKITYGREHYLRFDLPTTWQIWEDHDMEWDSTLNYADQEGFRCGVCYEFSVFNILTSKKLRLKEKPLIVMEASFSAYQVDIEADEMEKKISHLINKTKKYGGEFVFLWHNNSFNTTMWKKYQNVYEKVIKCEN